MSTWTNIQNTSNTYKIFYADAQTNQMSGDFCKEYRLFDSSMQDSVIMDVNDTVGAVGNCRIELMLRNSLDQSSYVGHLGNTSVVATRIHTDTVDNTTYGGVYLLYDGAKTLTICYGQINNMTHNFTSNEVINATITQTGTVTIQWDVITTTDNNYILTKLSMWSGTAWTKLAVTGFNIPDSAYTLGKIGIGAVNLAAGCPNDSSFFDAVKIYLPA